MIEPRPLGAFARRQRMPVVTFELARQIGRIGLDEAFLREEPQMLVGAHRQSVISAWDRLTPHYPIRYLHGGGYPSIDAVKQCREPHRRWSGIVQIAETSIDHRPLDFASWRHSLQKICGDLEVDRLPHMPFEGQVRARDVFGCSGVLVGCNGGRVTRSYRAARRSDPIYFLIVQLKGSGRMIQGVEEAHLSAGDMTLIRSEAPSEFIFEGFSRQLSIHLPKGLLEGRMLGRPTRAGRAISGHNGAGRVIRAMLSSADEDALGLGLRGLLATQLIDLVACVAAESVVPDGEGSKAYEVHLGQVIELIERRLSDSELTIDDVAKQYGLSARHLQRLLASRGTTFSRLVRERRLQHCAEDLHQARLRSASITDIAFSWGFNDMTHFSRAFRKQYQSSPREYRRRAL